MFGVMSALLAGSADCENNWVNQSNLLVSEWLLIAVSKAMTLVGR